jgi:hypothetical protein
MAEAYEKTDANLQQYQAVWDLEQDRWDLSEWGCPVAKGWSPSSPPSLLQGEDEESSESEEEPDGGEICDLHENSYMGKLRDSADLHFCNLVQCTLLLMVLRMSWACFICFFFKPKTTWRPCASGQMKCLLERARRIVV